LNYLDSFSTNTQITDFKKIRRVVAEFHADRRRDGRTDITKLTVAFRNFANAPEKKKKTISSKDSNIIETPFRSIRTQISCSVQRLLTFLPYTKHRNNFSYPEAPLHTCENIYRPGKVYSGEKNSVSAKLLSSKCICKELLHTNRIHLAGYNVIQNLRHFTPPPPPKKKENLSTDVWKFLLHFEVFMHLF